VSRRLAWVAIPIALGLGIRLTGWVNPELGYACFAVAIVWICLLPRAVSQRLPSVALEHGDGFAIRIRPPVRQGKRRLRRDTTNLVRDIWSYLKSVPDDQIESLQAWQDNTRRMQQAKDEAGKNAIWNEYTNAMTLRYSQQGRDLTERFGGQIQYLVSEYQRRRLLDASEAHRLVWQSGSRHWIQSTATTLEALALRV
jgi:hypothetical protein